MRDFTMVVAILVVVVLSAWLFGQMFSSDGSDLSDCVIEAPSGSTGPLVDCP